MGVAFVFIIYVMGLALVTVPAALVGLILGLLLSRGPYRRLRKRFMLLGALAPPMGAGYVVFCIVVMAAFGLLTHRDFGFGDGFELPLRNGYQFSAIDVPDVATLYFRGHAVISDGSSEQIGKSAGPEIDNVFALQENGDWLYGSRNIANPRFGDDKRIPNRWFLLNTRLLQLEEVTSEPAFEALLRQHGLKASLLASEDFYGTHRYRWYDLTVFCLLLVPPAFALWLLAQIVRRMRANAASIPDSRTIGSEARYLVRAVRARFLS